MSKYLDTDQAAAYLPDAFRIDAGAKRVDVYEVEVSHPLEHAQAARLTRWAVWMRDQGWAMRLGLVDRRGTCVAVDPFTMSVTDAEFERARRLMENAPGFR